MHVCKVWDSEYPWDVRVEKICRSLARGGHEVHLVCRNRRREPVREVRDGVSIHRLRPWPRRLDGVASFPAFCNPVWIAAISRVVREQSCDLILVRDLPLALAGVVAGRLTGRPVVLDVAENYPAMLRDFWPTNRRRPFNWLARNPWISRWIERVAIRWVDHILVVVPESMERLRGMGVEDGRVSVVMNTPLPERFLDAKAPALEAEAANPHFDVLYLGFLDPARGLDTAVRAMPAIVAGIANARLVVIGTGEQEEYLQDLARHLGVADHVSFQGWVPYGAAHGWIAGASVGIVPHVATESWMTTIPNKLFDYMAFGKPVVVSEAAPPRRIVTEERCGLVFRDRDAADFATQVLRLADAGVRRRLGASGRRAVVERYNWGVDEKALREALEGVQRMKGWAGGDAAAPGAR